MTRDQVCTQDDRLCCGKCGVLCHHVTSKSGKCCEHGNRQGAHGGGFYKVHLNGGGRSSVRVPLYNHYCRLCQDRVRERVYQAAETTRKASQKKARATRPKKKGKSTRPLPILNNTEDLELFASPIYSRGSSDYTLLSTDRGLQWLHQEAWGTESLLVDQHEVYGGHLLSDHTSIDMLLLEAEMKNVLIEIEAVGLAEEDCLSLPADEEKTQGDEDAWPSLPPSVGAKSIKEDPQEERKDGERDEEDEDDWEVLSADSSVWTVETFAEAKSYRDAVMEFFPKGGVTLDAADVRSTPKPTVGTSTFSRTVKLKNRSVAKFELLEPPDVCASIWGSIKDLRGGKRNLMFKGNQKKR